MKVDVYNFDTLTLIDRLQPIIGRKSHLFVHDLLNRGGYIAGGFARILMHSIGAKLTNNGLIEETQKLNSGLIEGYLGCCYRTQKIPVYKNDIDVFFESQDDLDKTILVNPWHDFQHSTSLCDNAINVYIDDRTLFQIVTRFVAPVDEMLETFDIANACIAFSKDKIHINREWFYLENQRMLKVNKWTHTYTANRLYSWKNRHEYLTIDVGCVKQFNENIKNVLQRLNKNGNIENHSGFIEQDWNRLQGALRHELVKYLDTDLLMILCSLESPYNGYNWALKEFKKRSMSLVIGDAQ